MSISAIALNNQTLGSSKQSMNKIEKGLIATRFSTEVYINNISSQGDNKFKDRKVTLYDTPDGLEIGPLQEDPDPYYMIYEPENPLANQDGYVQKRKDKTLENTVDLMSASQVYHLLISAAGTLSKMDQAASKLGDA